MSAARSMSPIKTQSTSPQQLFKTPSLMNINMEDGVDETKDQKIKDLEKMVAALKGELHSLRLQADHDHNTQQFPDKEG